MMKNLGIFAGFSVFSLSPKGSVFFSLSFTFCSHRTISVRCYYPFIVFYSSNWQISEVNRMYNVRFNNWPRWRWSSFSCQCYCCRLHLAFVWKSLLNTGSMVCIITPYAAQYTLQNTSISFHFFVLCLWPGGLFTFPSRYYSFLACSLAFVYANR